MRSRHLENRPHANVKAPRLPLLVFGGVFFTLGLLLSIPLLFRPITTYVAARNWVPVDARVELSQVDWEGSGSDRSFHPHIVYHFQVEGEAYSGNRFNLFPFHNSGYYERVVRAHPPESIVRIFVDPHRPTRSVIDRRIPVGAIFGILPLAFLLSGFFVLRYALRMNSRRVSFKQARKNHVIFKPFVFSATCISLLFVVIWSGFTIPFYLVGPPGPIRYFFAFIWLILVKSLLSSFIKALRAPYPIITLSPGCITSGGLVSVNWRIVGKIERIQRMQITAYCAEQRWGSTKRGNTTHTSIRSKDIYLDEIFNATIRSELSDGTLTLSLPADAPTSVSVSNDAGYAWRLDVQCHLDNDPDIKLSFPFTVYSQAQLANHR